MDFPLFRDPAGYLKKRDGRFAIKTYFKRRYEYRAIDKALAGADDITSVCDIPCGPGRLFSFWKSKSWEVTGMDLSEEMVSAATEAHANLQLAGSVEHHNAFEPREAAADLVASVRFVYYFEAQKRIELLKSLAKMSNRYLLAQYKTVETRKGRENARKPLNKNKAFAKYHCSHDELANEIREAGLNLIRIVPISQASDRVFVLCEK